MTRQQTKRKLKDSIWDNVLEILKTQNFDWFLLKILYCNAWKCIAVYILFNIHSGNQPISQKNTLRSSICLFYEKKRKKTLWYLLNEWIKIRISSQWSFGNQFLSTSWAFFIASPQCSDNTIMTKTVKTFFGCHCCGQHIQTNRAHQFTVETPWR